MFPFIWNSGVFDLSHVSLSSEHKYQDRSFVFFSIINIATYHSI